jgi:stage III sporulation protein AG
LIFISSFFDKEKENKEQNLNLTAESYRAELEKGVEEIVRAVSGDKKPTVVITLESGIRYTYADSLKADSENSQTKESEKKSESESRSYITVKNSDGSETPLIITENMPKVRGVAIVCDNGNVASVNEKIKNAVTSALDITEKRVYISGGN